MVYLASATGFLNSVYTTVLRSIITKMVPDDEIGKVFSVLEFLKTIESLLCPVIYGTLYENTVSSVPKAFIFLTLSTHILVFISALILNLSKRGKLFGMQVSTRKSFQEKSNETTTKM